MPEDDVAERDDDQAVTERSADAAETAAPAAVDTSRTVGRLTIVLGVVAVAFLVLFVLTFLDRGRLQDEVDRTAEIADVAGEFGVTLYTYDYRDIDGQLDRMEALSTPSFAEEYRESFEANLRAQIEERQVVSESELTDVLVSRSEGDQARAIVIASTSVSRENGTTATISGLIDVSMLKVGGDWLVDKVLTIANDGSVTDADGNPIETAPVGDVPATSSSSIPSVPDDSVEEPADSGD